MKDLNNQTAWNIKIGSKEIMNVAICIIIKIQHRDRQDSRNLNNDTFFKLPVSFAQCLF